MISIDKLIQQLGQCKDTSIILPTENENLKNKYIQKTAVDIRKIELESIDTIESNDDINRLITKCTVDDFQQTQQKTIENNNLQNNNVPSKSLIVYSENECAALPEVLTNIFKLLCLKNNKIKLSDWYIYGVRNPESFYKSFMLLIQLDFIIKNKVEKKNSVSTLKREMALQYENFHKLLNYKKYHFSKHTMVNNLTNTDNYTDIDVYQYIADYTKTNFILLDIINEQYFDIQYNQNTLIQEFNNQYGKEYIVIIKYTYNTFLPLMNTNGQHSLGNDFLEIIKIHFEMTNFKGYTHKETSIPINESIKPENIIQCDSLILNDIDNKVIIEDMIKINDNYNDNININEKTVEENDDISDRLLGNKPIDLNILMNKIPVNNKKPKLKSEKKQIIDINDIIRDTSTTTTTSNKEELKPLSKYTLSDLQMLAKLHKISTQKPGKVNKPVNKTKEEIYNDLSAL